MDELHEVKWTVNYPMEMQNGRVKMRKKNIGQRRLIYDVYDNEGKEQILLGTCEVMCKKEKNKRVPVLVEYTKKDERFTQYLQIAEKITKRCITEC